MDAKNRPQMPVLVLSALGITFFLFGLLLGAGGFKQISEMSHYNEAERLAARLSRYDRASGWESVLQKDDGGKLHLMDRNGDYVIVVNGSFQLRIKTQTASPEIQPLGTLGRE